MKRLLIVDDEVEMLKGLEKIFSHRSDFDLTLTSDSTEARELASKKKFDLIISDLKMPEVSGLEILETAINHFPDTQVIIISGYGTIEASVEAIKKGAFDFIEKPFTSKKLFEYIDRAFLNKIQHKKEFEENDEESDEDRIPGIIYKSNAMKEIIKLIKKIASGKMNILITGESGTGKELLARAIHNLSKSKTDPFVPVNCGALPETLFESELFGHEKGAFTGAIKTKPGLLEFANHGTFFLDEIGELSETLQVKLLRMLEERKIRRVGGQDEIEIDVRIIAASNKDLLKAVNQNKFREDLYYRLSMFHIEIPPIRERTEDIILLAEHFLAEVCKKEDRGEKKLSVEAEEALKRYSWPGNIREIQNVIGRAYILCSNKIIDIDDLPLPLSNTTQKIDHKFLNPDYNSAKELILENFEIEYLTHHLKKNNGNISKTAQQCGMDRRTIHRLIKKYNIFYQ
jgi:DNA-binding NtrC family response regulator